MAVGLGGTCVAILTFALFCLYPLGLRRSEPDPVPRDHRGTRREPVPVRLCVRVLLLVLDLLLERRSEAKTYLDRADGCVTLGLVLLVVEPAFILFTINLLDLGLIALGLWFGFILLLIVVQRNFRSGARAGPPAL